MPPKLPLFFIFVFTFMFISLPSVQAVSVSIETFPLSDPYRKLPVKIYWEDSKECPGKFNEVLKKTLDVAIVLLRKSIYRFMEENDGVFDEFVKFRIEYAKNLNETSILVTGRQLGEEEGGRTVLYRTMDGKVIRAEIYYDCETILKPAVPALNIVLHELLHALGLGHTELEKVGDEYELMFPYQTEKIAIYISNLDLEVLYNLWFRDYDREVYTTDSSFQFKQVKPYVVELQELEEIYRDLQSKYSSMNMEVSNLKSDVVVLKSDIAEIKNTVARVGEYLEKHEEELRDVSEELNATERFVLAKAGEYDYKFKVVGNALNEVWITVQDLKNVTISNNARINGLEQSLSRFNFTFTLILMFMLVVLVTTLYLVLKVKSLDSKIRVLGGGMVEQY